MKPSRCIALSAVAVAIAASGVASASAAESPADEGTPVRIVYRAPRTCPNESVFTTRFRARATRVRPAWPGEPAPTLTVTLTNGARGASGTLRVVGLHGEASEERAVASETCEDVATAIALAAALTVDPMSGRSTAGDESEVGEPPRPGPATTTTTTSASTPGRERPAAAPAAISASEEPWRVGVAALGTVQSGTSPELVLAPSISAELRAPWRGHSAIRAGVARASSGTVAVPDGAARFTWTAALLDVCPFAFERGMLALSPCARVEAGALEGEGERIAPARSQTRAWFAAAGLTRLRIAPTGTWFIEFEGGVRAALLRDRFVVHPDATVFRAPVAAFFAGAGVGVLFP